MSVQVPGKWGATKPGLSRRASGPLDCLDCPGEREEGSWHFSVFFEGHSAGERRARFLSRAQVFHLRVLCHHRLPCSRYSGCREYTWQVARRFSEFAELEAALRASGLLAPSAALPRKTLLRHHCPSPTFVRQRAQELLRFLDEVLDTAASRASSQPERFRDAADVDASIPRFLGLVPERKGASSRAWAMPPGAQERPAALVYTVDRGIYIWGHRGRFASGFRLTRFDRQATLGDLNVTHAEVRGPPGKSFMAGGDRQEGMGPWRRSHSVSDAALLSGQVATPPVAGFTPSSSPKLRPSLTPSMSPSMTPSMSTSMTPSMTPMPLASPPRSSHGSRAHSPDTRKRLETEDFFLEESMMLPISETMVRQPDAVWVEANLDMEWQKDFEHSKWFREVLVQKSRGKKPVRGARRVDSMAVELGATKDGKDEIRRRTIVEYESKAALWRELCELHDGLHPILGYGVEGQTFVTVHEAALGYTGLRTFGFTPVRCLRIYAQALHAISFLHQQFVPHGHLSPESLIIEDACLGCRVRIAWTPGQRRPEGHASATLGFRAPEGGRAADPGDIWALACVMLVWRTNFDPVPHPWTQFAKSHRLQQDIRLALASEPPVLPKALLDLHLAAAQAEEPRHTFLSLLASSLTESLSWEPAQRPTASQLLRSRFFEQAL